MTYKLTFCGGMVPTQAEGRLQDGRPFYFRARGGTWTLYTGCCQGDPISYDQWNGDVNDLVASGLDPTHGAMTVDEVMDILDEHIGPREIQEGLR